MARSAKLREVGQGQALGSPRRGESNQASGRQDRRVFFTLGQTDSGGGGGVYWVETSKLPTIANDAWVSPLGATPPVVPTLAVVALVLRLMSQRV